MSEHDVVLVDTNTIIEAVRTGCWRAITGVIRVESVEECREEARRGDSTRPGYVHVSQADLDRIAAVHPVDDAARAALALTYEAADALDSGERDLFAYALGLAEQNWLICSPDKASIRAAVALGHGDRLVSLEEMARRAGVNPRPPLLDHFSTARLREWRTAALLGTL